jgi:hypothetical protein
MAVALLREGVDAMATDPAAQQRVEHWCKQAGWPARSVALPLALGVDPAAWQAHVAQQAAQPQAELLWHSLATHLQLSPALDPVITPEALQGWARHAGFALPLALQRLLDFMRAVLPREATPALAAAAPTPLRAEAEVTLLGAALAQVTRQPAGCVDAAGYYDAVRIVAAIYAQAVLWFPFGPPPFTREEAVTLIARWLPAAFEIQREAASDG